MELNRKTISGSFLSIVAVIVNQIFGIVVLALLARHLDAKEFGLVAIVVLAIELTQDLMLAGIPDYLVRNRTWSEDIAVSGFCFQLVVGVGLVCLGLTTGAILLNAGERQVGLIFLSLAPVHILEALAAIPMSRLRFDFRYGILAGCSVATNLVAACGAALLAINGYGLWALVANRILLSATMAVLVWVFAQWRPSCRPNWTTIRSVLSFSAHLAGARLLSVLNMRIVDIIVGAVGGAALLGMYQLAGRGVSLLLQALLAPIQSVALSAFATAEKRAEMMVLILRFTSVIVFPASAGLAAIAPEVVGIVYGDNWAVLELPLAIMVVAAVPAIVNYMLVPGLTAAGYPREVLVFTLILTGLSALFALITVRFGLIAIATGFVARTLLGSCFALVILKRRLGLRPTSVLRQFMPAMAGSALLFLCIEFARSFLIDFDRIVIAGVLIVIGGFVYALTNGRQIYHLCREIART